MNASKPIIQYVLIAFVALAFLISLVFVGRGVKDMKPLIEIRCCGHETHGVIINKTWDPSIGRRIRYSYEVLGDVHENVVPVSAGAWDSLEIGSNVNILFHRSDPGRSILAAYDILIWGAGFDVMLWILLSVLLAYALNKGIKNIRTT